MKYRKKPIIIDAIQFETNNEAGAKNMNDVVNWIEENGGKTYHNFTDIFIETLEGRMKAEVKDWIIQGINGEFYPCKPDIFEKTYENLDKHMEE